MTTLRQWLTDLTQPINGQYPRPWTTTSKDPETSRVFFVGQNQATPFAVSLCSHVEFVDSLLDPDRSVALYRKARPDGSPSPTRVNIDRFMGILGGVGVADVLQTNVVCYGTKRTADLKLPKHAGGRGRGQQVFLSLVERVRPRVLIVAGAGSAKDLGRLLGLVLPPAASAAGEPPSFANVTFTRCDSPFPISVLVLPSLSPPPYNAWIRRAPTHMRAAAELAAAEVHAAGDRR